jgi:hypothetical protein
LLSSSLASIHWIPLFLHAEKEITIIIKPITHIRVLTVAGGIQHPQQSNSGSAVCTRPAFESISRSAFHFCEVTQNGLGLQTITISRRRGAGVGLHFNPADGGAFLRVRVLRPLGSS